MQGPQSGLFYTRHLDWQNTEHRECKVPVWGWWPCGYPISRQICSLCWSSGWIVANREVTRFFTRPDHGFHDGQKPKRNDFGGSEVSEPPIKHRNLLKRRQNRGLRGVPGSVWWKPVYRPDGVRCIGGVTLMCGPRSADSSADRPSLRYRISKPAEGDARCRG